MLDDILAKYPDHKRALYIKSRYDNNEVLTPAEMNDLKRFHKVITSKG